LEFLLVQKQGVRLTAHRDVDRSGNGVSIELVRLADINEEARVAGSFEDM
jgi:hypothetical protein